MESLHQVAMGLNPASLERDHSVYYYCKRNSTKTQIIRGKYLFFLSIFSELELESQTGTYGSLAFSQNYYQNEPDPHVSLSRKHYRYI